GMTLFMLTAWSVQVGAQEPVKKKEKEKTEMVPMTKKANHEKSAKKACDKTVKEKKAAAACCNKTKAEQSAVAYQCSMKCEGDKTYDKPGKCPKCGMELKKVKKKGKTQTP
ncbi:MAG: hypothetical protein J7K46_07035, partial [Bacteroidales bacterium]|nr:hypothetical protein [Bacteroidales bacterium]